MSKLAQGQAAVRSGLAGFWWQQGQASKTHNSPLHMDSIHWIGWTHILHEVQ